MSKRFATHASTEDHDLIIQFSVAFEQDIDCGGGYMKLLVQEPDGQRVRSSGKFNRRLANSATPRNRIPSDAKPSDWDDRERIADPNNKIPDNWELPELIEDIEATKPDDWDDKADGDWSALMKTNPAYIGKWVPRTIDNPDCKGPWFTKQIPNPEYVEDHTIGIFKDIGLIGIDVLQVKSGTIFGNFLITNDVDLARQAADAIVETSKKERTVKKKIDDKEMEKCVRRESSQMIRFRMTAMTKTLRI
ncbi:hypothetical protein GJ496_008546 [Pomphorhynchus laevis]|nr:hypothetical protein GJ496_008546 [Pomphorhynchus laevis]